MAVLLGVEAALGIEVVRMAVVVVVAAVAVVVGMRVRHLDDCLLACFALVRATTRYSLVLGMYV